MCHRPKPKEEKRPGLSSHGLTSICEQPSSIGTVPTREMTPRDEEEDISSRAISALVGLSVEDRTQLGEKLTTFPLQAGEKRRSRRPAAETPFRVVLHHAVITGNVAAVKAALGSGASPNERDCHRHSSLHFAAARGDVDCLTALMADGARVNVANRVGWSPLHYAVIEGHTAIVEALLKRGAYPTFRDNHLISPLHLACTQPGNLATFRKIAQLLGVTALSARDELGQTPLHVACSCGNVGAVEVLLALGAEALALDNKGNPPGRIWQKQVAKESQAKIWAYLAEASEREQAPAEPEAEVKLVSEPAVIPTSSECGEGGHSVATVSARVAMAFRAPGWPPRGMVGMTGVFALGTVGA
ncbi:unnamed protein product [Discosporangium mesarthrocarpum]